MHFLQAINSDISVLIVCNKTGGTIKGDKKVSCILQVSAFSRFSDYTVLQCPVFTSFVSSEVPHRKTVISFSNHNTFFTLHMLEIKFYGVSNTKQPAMKPTAQAASPQLRHAPTAARLQLKCDGTR